MKVGTDGVLLGAWVDLRCPHPATEPFRLLEIGCGCGVISLMIAQRLQQSGLAEKAVIHAVDIDRPSCEEASLNVAASCYRSMIQVAEADFRCLPASYQTGTFSLIVSNPPFFSQALKSPEARRNRARHNDTLPFEALLCQADRLLQQGGSLALVLPPEAFGEVERIILKEGLGWQKSYLTHVYSLPEKPCERMLCRWTKIDRAEKEIPLQENRLFLQQGKGGYSAAYKELVKDFYLWA